MILVKAAPVLTSQLEESMCVAAVAVEGTPRWVRLHPVPFRDLADDLKFKKYQIVRTKVGRPKTDRRPESLLPLGGSLRPGRVVSTRDGWAERRRWIDALGERTMCELVEANRAGSGPGVPSLAVVRPADQPQLEISVRDEDQLRKWRTRAAAMESQPSLFDDPDKPKPPFEVVPWRFRYKYRCRAAQCNGHSQTIVDWEVVALWRRVQHKPDWQDQMRRRFVDELWAPGRDTVLFVGNQEQYPISFLVLGIFWPPAGPVQTSLL